MVKKLAYLRDGRRAGDIYGYDTGVEGSGGRLRPGRWPRYLTFKNRDSSCYGHYAESCVSSGLSHESSFRCLLDHSYRRNQFLHGGKATIWLESDLSDEPLRNPVIGIAGCCACAASGHAAAPPSSVMNWRRLMSSMGSSPEPAVPAYRRLRMPRKRPQVLGVDLNCSESRRGAAGRFPPEPLISAPRRPAGGGGIPSLCPARSAPLRPPPSFAPA